MTEAYVIDGLRTPFGRYGGALASVRTDDLAALPIAALKDRHVGLDWARLDDVIFGCANQAGEDNRNVARMALLLAGCPSSRSGHHDQPALRLGPRCGDRRRACDQARANAI
jgi:acetyl-CoA acetyltransferase